MKIKFHRLLQKQLKKDLNMEPIPENLGTFIQAVNSAYIEFENDRELMERSIDISSREYNEKNLELKIVQERLANLVETIPMGIIIIDCAGKFELANSVAEQIFGLPRTELIGRSYKDQHWQLKNADGSELKDDWPLKKVIKTGQPMLGVEYAITTGAGQERILSINAAPYYDRQGNITGIVASMEDITIRKQMEAQLKYLSLHDKLTGLYNRTLFEREMSRLRTGRYSPVGIIMCDIDGLKLVNDTLGHKQGDQLLLLASKLIKSCFREQDVVARIGGDEFAILLAKTSQAELENSCRILRETIGKYSGPELRNIPISISVGFAIKSGFRVNMTDLFKEADNNMYREKLHHQQSVRSSIVQTLVKAMEVRDFITEGHADRMQGLAEEFARKLGITEEKIADLRLLAHFHDIGKVGIPDRILCKAGPLTEEERSEMQRHCEIGHRIAHSATDLVVIADLILKHHEWWNGAGYPLGLKGKEIPIECRIISIVDAYDAMTNDRPYRRAMSHERAAAEIKSCAGEQFDPDLVVKFLQLFNHKEEKRDSGIVNRN
jgi:diguanylate cyclase (GGDEF)-like protein/PAS domain S-box-containing protein